MTGDAPRLPGSLRNHPELDSWVRIDSEADGTVTLFSGKVELGQGLRTALALIGAEELDVELSRIRVEMADSARTPHEFYTAGSQSIEDSGRALRWAAAHARAVLIERAAAELGVHAAELAIEDGRIAVRDGAGRARQGISYWTLMGGKRFACRITGAAPLKDPARYRLVGKPGHPRLDLPGKVFGRPSFVHDMSLPGMLHGRVVRAADPRAALAALDDSGVQGRDGVVRVVRDGSFVGVIAEREEQAVRAAERLLARAQWLQPELPTSSRDLPGYLRAHVSRSLPVHDGIAVDAAVPAFAPPSGRQLRATYFRPFLRHASLAPSAALALFEADRVTLYTHAQGVSILAASIAQVLGIPAASVRAIHVEGAGCYGHNGADDAALDAVLLARAVPGRPVLLQWSRAAEHAWAPYGPASVVDMEAVLDDSRRIAAWSHEVYSPTHLGRSSPGRSGRFSALLAASQLERPLEAPKPRPTLGVPHSGIHRNADPIYRLPYKRIVKHFVADSPLRTSALRSLGAFANVFAIESFMDELASAASVDPIEFRLRHLDDPRARQVIEAAATRAGWRGGALANAGDNACGQGFAFARYKNQKTYAALVIEVEISNATLQVLPRRVVIAADAGQVIDPDGLVQQLEGGVIQALSWSLLEEVRFEPSGVQSVDFEGYPILDFDRVPEFDTLLIDRPGEAPLGAGEATQGPTPAALANAVFAATGLRLRRLPFDAGALRAAASGGEQMP